MHRKFFVLTGILALVLFSSGMAAGQAGQGERIAVNDEAPHLGENLEVTLVVDTTGASESFTIVTAAEGFLVETQVGKGEERIKLQFDGRIVFKERQLIIGERRLESVKPILVRYRIKMQGVENQKEGGYTFGLEGSAFLWENREIVIARTAGMTLKLKIGRMVTE